MKTEKALSYLLNQTDASEYTDVYEDCNIAWNVIASIMDSYAKKCVAGFLTSVESNYIIHGFVCEAENLDDEIDECYTRWINSAAHKTAK